MAITTEHPKYSEELLTAVERALSAHDLRLKAGILPENVLDTMTANQCEVQVLHGQLAVTMHGAPVHSQNVIEGLARDRRELFYPRSAELGAVKCRDEMDAKSRIAFIREKGLAEFEKLPQTAPKDTPVSMDPRRMTRAQYLSLSRAQRVDFVKQFGTGAVEQVMSRVK